LVYLDKKTGKTYAKRFKLGGVIVDKDYSLAPGNIRVEKLFDRHGIVLQCDFAPAPRQKTNMCMINFEEVGERSRGARGFLVTDKKIERFLQIKRGSSIEPDNNTADNEETAQATDETKS
ncbi:MAG: hypothetical protein D6820_16210, partial [Lentisphaerae bacterium]